MIKFVLTADSQFWRGDSCYAYPSCYVYPSPVYVAKVPWGVRRVYWDSSIYKRSPTRRPWKFFPFWSQTSVLFLLSSSCLLLFPLSVVLPLFSLYPCLFSLALFLDIVFTPIYIWRLFYLSLYPISLYSSVVAQPSASNPEVMPTARQGITDVGVEGWTLRKTHHQFVFTFTLSKSFTEFRNLKGGTSSN